MKYSPYTKVYPVVIGCGVILAGIVFGPTGVFVAVISIIFLLFLALRK